MKVLGKLQINSEKIIKNEELMNLRGGYDFPPNCEAPRFLMHCYCLYNPGEWDGCYNNDYEWSRAIEEYCNYIGFCFHE
jgi:hypothetical protein